MSVFDERFNYEREQIAALDASGAFNAQAHVQQTKKELSKADADYWPLKSILNDALAQAASGKGKERHANDKPFDRQPIMEISRMVGAGFPLGQAIKKAQEATGMLNRGEKDAAIRELLGVINYAAAAVHLIKEAGR